MDESFKKSLDDRTATIAVVGLGYVGLPLVLVFAEKGFSVVGFDIDASKIDALLHGRSYIRHIPKEQIVALNTSGRFDATSDYSRISDADVILLCVPTPLTRHREPDMTFVLQTAESVRQHLGKGQLIVLESTTYPGTTHELLKPLFEADGAKCGEDFFLAYSPEREDPGNADHSTKTIPKVVAGETQEACDRAKYLYEQVVPEVIPVSSTATAEAVKLTENIFRCINIALVNELKMVYSSMGIDVWEVIDAAKTKPFGYMAFYPGPGLGGHCIPIDPFYLTWKAREYGCKTRFIELAGEVNISMPEYVIGKLANALNDLEKPLKNSSILMVGMAYKKDVDDIRESPALALMKLLNERGASTDYHDPFVAEIMETRAHPEFAGKRSVSLSPESIAAYDAVLIVTDHSEVDYDALVRHAKFVVDTRNATKNVKANRDKIVKA